MKKIILFSALCAFLASSLAAQSYAFGLKSGLTLGNQQWSGIGNRNILYKYHGIAFIETADEDNKFALFAQAGYHQKGSALRFFSGNYTNPTTGKIETYPSSRTEYIFHNISLTLGGKKKFDFSGYRFYYMFGVRGEYTAKTNLQKAPQLTGFFNYQPNAASVRPWNFGVTAGGGTEFRFSEFVQGILEVSVSPDFSRQYYDPPYANFPIYDPGTNTFIRGTLPEQSIRNFTFEISLGLRFLRKIQYVD